jgi:hypothetical protein
VWPGTIDVLETVTTNIPILPEWAKIVAFNLLGIYVILQLIHLILKKLQTAELRSAASALKNLSEETIRKAGGRFNYLQNVQNLHFLRW